LLVDVEYFAASRELYRQNEEVGQSWGLIDALEMDGSTILVPYDFNILAGVVEEIQPLSSLRESTKI
jgi:hypothetical protein